MDLLNAFGLVSVTACLVCYASRSARHGGCWRLPAPCAMSSVYGFLQGAWPFGIVEIFWTLIALRRWCG